MIDRIDHIVMNCRDVETTASWYERVLGFQRAAYTSPAEPGERIALKFGRHKFNLRQTGSLGWVTCKVDAPGSLDLCFITEGSLKPVIERLNSLGIPITMGPAPRTGALGRMTSIYCEDPDGNLVEVATYAAQTGCPLPRPSGHGRVSARRCVPDAVMFVPQFSSGHGRCVAVTWLRGQPFSNQQLA